ncbi:MAG: hypothetical protein ACRCZF_27875, partial [Gemmataceae bacterium]
MLNPVNINGGQLAVSSTVFTTSRTFTIGSNGALITAFAAITFNGPITGSGTLERQVGNGLVTLASNSSGFTGVLRNSGGTFTFNSNGKLGASTNAVDNSGTVSLDNVLTNVNNRLSSRPVILRGAVLTYLGNAAAASSETFGSLTIEQGQSLITVTPNASQSSTIALNSVLRQNNATLVVRGTGLGNAAGPNVAVVTVDTVPPLIGGGGDPTTPATVATASIVPFMSRIASATTVNGSTHIGYEPG